MLDVLNLIDKATERANTPKASRKPVFLFLSEGQKALVRPMFNLTDAIAMPKHNKWHDNREFRINAICGAEVGKECQHCADAIAMEDKKRKASPVIFLPVYVYQVVNSKTGEKITYTEKDDAGNETEKPISGFRVLELPLFGKAFNILQALRSYMRDEDDHDIRVCDFVVEQNGSGTSKNFVVIPKAPKPVNPKITDNCPGIDRFHEAILGACPPLVAGDPAIDGVVAAVKNGQSAQKAMEDDDIPEF